MRSGLILALLFVLTDVDASTMARYLWGSDGFAKRAGRNFQIGCVVQGSRLIVAVSKVSWEDAFARVNMKTNGPRQLGASARDASGNVGESAPVTVYLCNP